MGDCSESRNCTGFDGVRHGDCINGRCECHTGWTNANCTAKLECKFWDEELGTWSSEGLIASPPRGGSPDGFFYCESSHLTDFGGVVRIPMSAEELFDELSGIKLNVFTLDELGSALGSFTPWSNPAIFTVLTLSTTIDIVLIVFTHWRWQRRRKGKRRRRTINKKANRSESELKAIFASFDTDGSGSLDLDELTQALARAGKALSREEVQKIADAVDKNGDGQIDREEFSQIFKLAPEMLPSAVRELIDAADLAAATAAGYRPKDWRESLRLKVYEHLLVQREAARVGMEPSSQQMTAAQRAAALSIGRMQALARRTQRNAQTSYEERTRASQVVQKGMRRWKARAQAQLEAKELERERALRGPNWQASHGLFGPLPLGTNGKSTSSIVYGAQEPDERWASARTRWREMRMDQAMWKAETDLRPAAGRSTAANGGLSTPPRRSAALDDARGGPVGTGSGESPLTAAEITPMIKLINSPAKPSSSRARASSRGKQAPRSPPPSPPPPSRLMRPTRASSVRSDEGRERHASIQAAASQISEQRARARRISEAMTAVAAARPGAYRETSSIHAELRELATPSQQPRSGRSVVAPSRAEGAEALLDLALGRHGLSLQHVDSVIAGRDPHEQRRCAEAEAAAAEAETRAAAQREKAADKKEVSKRVTMMMGWRQPLSSAGSSEGVRSGYDAEGFDEGSEESFEGSSESAGVVRGEGLLERTRETVSSVTTEDASVAAAPKAGNEMLRLKMLAEAGRKIMEENARVRAAAEHEKLAAQAEAEEIARMAEEARVSISQASSDDSTGEVESPAPAEPSARPAGWSRLRQMRASHVQQRAEEKKAMDPEQRATQIVQALSKGAKEAEASKLAKKIADNNRRLVERRISKESEREAQQRAKEVKLARKLEAKRHPKAVTGSRMKKTLTSSWRHLRAFWRSYLRALQAEHTIVAAVAPNSEDTAGDHLRDENVAHIFFLTMMSELCVLCLLRGGAEVPLFSITTVINGAITTGVCGVIALLAKRLFRFGNKLRWRRKSPEKEHAAMLIQRRFRLKKKLRRRNKGLRARFRRCIKRLRKICRRVCRRICFWRRANVKDAYIIKGSSSKKRGRNSRGTYESSQPASLKDMLKKAAAANGAAGSATMDGIVKISSFADLVKAKQQDEHLRFGRFPLTAPNALQGRAAQRWVTMHPKLHLFRFCLAWSINSSLYVVACIVCLVYGVIFSAPAFTELLLAWTAALIFTWAVVEPSEVLGIVLFPFLSNNQVVMSCRGTCKDLGFF